MDVYVARMGEMRNIYQTLVGKSEGRRPVGRPRITIQNKFLTNVDLITIYKLLK
jgi:hypothetical protein